MYTTLQEFLLDGLAGVACEPLVASLAGFTSSRHTKLGLHFNLAWQFYDFLNTECPCPVNYMVEEIPRQGRLEGCHRMSAATHLICGLKSV